MTSTLLTLPGTTTRVCTLETTLQQIVDDLAAKHYCVLPAGMPQSVQSELSQKLEILNNKNFTQAQIGRGSDEQHNKFVRRNRVHWLQEHDPDISNWLGWVQDIKQALNRNLFLGLDTFESHLALYQPGDYYRRHTDAFRGERNRVVSLVSYLNQGWQPDQGGELVLYPEDAEPIQVTPEAGTLVLFLSEEIPHEVLTTMRTRSGFAGWFRVRTGNPLADLA